jgi:RNA polymerase sigma factor (TIGR02999 family)
MIESAPVPLGADAMFTQVYERLKAMAGRSLAMGSLGTHETTMIEHELYMRLSGNDGLAFELPEQFFVYAASAMRHLLADRARDRLRQRAGGDWARVTLTGADERLAIDSAEQALANDEALRKLEQTDERAARVVELIWFAGLTHEQAAATIGLNRRTIVRDWRFARAYLNAELCD